MDDVKSNQPIPQEAATCPNQHWMDEPHKSEFAAAARHVLRRPTPHHIYHITKAISITQPNLNRLPFAREPTLCTVQHRGNAPVLRIQAAAPSSSVTNRTLKVHCTTTAVAGVITSRCTMAAAAPARTILITVDERASSEKLFDYAIANILRPGDKLHILHVINPCKRPIGVVGDGLDGVIGDDAEARCEVERRARQFLRERFERHLKELHVPFKTEIARSCCDADSIGELLCKRAEQLNAAMVMLAKHKRGVLKTFFIGSVSNYCLSNCKQPVLVMQDC